MDKIKNKIPALRFPEFCGEWEVKRLGEFLNERIDFPDKELPLYSLTIEDGVVPKSQRYERSFLVNDEKNAYKRMCTNDFAFNPMNLRFGALAMHRELFDVSVSKYYNIFYCNEKADCRYMEIFLTSYNMIQYYERMATGSLIEKKRVHYLDFLNFKLLFPSLPEQQKIADFLTAVDDKINQLTRKKTLFEQYKKGVMQKIFSQEIRFKDDDGKDFPEWKVNRLGNIGTFKNGLNKSTEDFGFGYPFVNLMDVFGKSFIISTNFGLVNASEKELKEYNLQKGDVLFIRSSVKREGVGQAAVVLSDLNDTVYSGFLIRFRPDIEIELLFKKYSFATESFRNQVLSYSTTSANTNINQESLKIVRLSFPTLPEQQKIADFLTGIDKKIELVNTQLEKTKEWKRGLLQQMFV